MKRIGLLIVTNVLVLTLVTGIIFATGLWNYRGPGGLNLGTLALFSIVVGFTGSFISLAISKWMAKTMMGVQIVRPGSQDPYERWLVDTIYRQARQAGLKTMPEVGIYNSPEVNAFATGPSKNNSLVAVSSGLLQAMDHDGVEGVLGHEVAHIANGDMVTMTLLQGVINTFAVFLARMIAYGVSTMVRSELAFFVELMCIIVLQIVFTILGSLVVMAFSRHREFHADAGGARLAGRDKMISGLEQLRRHVEMVDRGQPALATMKISGGASGFMKLFSTHPPLEERIARLKSAA